MDKFAIIYVNTVFNKNSFIETLQIKLFELINNLLDLIKKIYYINKIL
jgi:hypothetical protein